MQLQVTHASARQPFSSLAIRPLSPTPDTLLLICTSASRPREPDLLNTYFRVFVIVGCLRYHAVVGASSFSRQPKALRHRHFVKGPRGRLFDYSCDVENPIWIKRKLRACFACRHCQRRETSSVCRVRRREGSTLDNTISSHQLECFYTVPQDCSHRKVRRSHFSTLAGHRPKRVSIAICRSAQDGPEGAQTIRCWLRLYFERHSRAASDHEIRSEWPSRSATEVGAENTRNAWQIAQSTESYI